MRERRGAHPASSDIAHACLPPEPRHSKSLPPQPIGADLITRLDYFSSDKRSLRDLPTCFFMSVRSAHPPLAISCVKFTNNPDAFNLITGLEDPTHLMALDIVVRPHSDEQSRALLAISCCPNLRSLDVVQGLLRDPREPKNHDLPWPAKLHLPHLRKLRIDPRLFVRFTDFLLSHCSNIEYLVVDILLQLDKALDSPVSLQTDDSLHRFPRLRTLTIIGDSRSLQWSNAKISLQSSRKLVKVSAGFGLINQSSKIADI